MQRSQNRTPQKLDFALNNFPPLPGSDGTQACPPPAPPPPALPDEGASNLADIVKGRKNKDGSSIPEKSASAPTTPTCVSLVTSSNGTGGTSGSGGGSNSMIPVSKALSTPVQPIPPVTPPQSPVPPPSPPPPVSLPPASSGPTSAVVVVNQAHKPQRVADKASFFIASAFADLDASFLTCVWLTWNVGLPERQGHFLKSWLRCLHQWLPTRDWRPSHFLS